MRYDQKVVAVTGAAVGIGKAAALAFGREGARVALLDRDPQSGNSAFAEFHLEGIPTILAIGDVAAPEDVQEMIAAVHEEWGRIDVLVNNAGVYVQGEVHQTSLEDWQRILDINLTGAFLCTRAVVPLMIEQGSGVIVNVASEAGLVGIGNQVAYNVSKAGLIALTRSCAVDLAKYGIRVNCVCPGTTETPLVKAALDRAADPVSARRRLESSRPMDRLGQPDEIASAIVYLASPGAGYATGSILSIDGGYTAQ
jgi:NAD(P)-dependent dehydrogenase (short-subunit alcohol dehydrogenase family)